MVSPAHSTNPALPTRRGFRFRRLPTGAKAFAFLSVALLPLALIGLFAALQTTRASDSAARAQLRVAAAESGRRLAIELNGDASVLGDAMNALAARPDDMAICARTTGVFAPQFAEGTRFSILGARGTAICGSTVDTHGLVALNGGVATAIVEDRGLLMVIDGPGRAEAHAFFPSSFLARIGRPGGSVADIGAKLEGGDAELVLTSLPPASLLQRRQQVRTPIGVDDLALIMTMPSVENTSPVLVAMLLPLLMWAAAAGFTWLVVDRLFIQPLRRLKMTVTSYRPGEVLAPVGGGLPQAEEIRDLYDSFHGLSRTVNAHETELAEGLVRQTKLTREVHHRVKNNLQVIASLINFHARGAISAEAAAAYASIQRRVDALAVVHRNHFAEMEDHRGLGLRSVISELSANIRATAPEGSRSIGIGLEVQPFLVSQDTAVAVAFLLTELVELAMTAAPGTQVRISARPDEVEGRALLRVVSPGLVEGDELSVLLAHRYGRVIEGLSRQLRSKLHHDPMVGAYEISIAIMGIE